MILRIPEYYDEFSCIADKCTDSCCAGWEVNVDEDSHDYYCTVPGEIGDRLRAAMYQDEDGDYGFKLQEKERCPFLNDRNLCDLVIAMGEESLCEVCTDYPRFFWDYANVRQKGISISCEEAGRIMFSKEEPLTFVEIQLEDGMEQTEELVEDSCDEEMECAYVCDEEEDEDPNWVTFLEFAQKNAILLLQNRKEEIGIRVNRYLSYLRQVQDYFNGLMGNEVCPEEANQLYQKVKNLPEEDFAFSNGILGELTYESYLIRRDVFDQMENLNKDWVKLKQQMCETLTEDSYDSIRDNFAKNEGCLQRDYEHLLVYYTFRFFMQAVYDYRILAKGLMAVAFTRFLYEMDMVRFVENRQVYGRWDRINVAHILAREVEHSEENVELAEEEFSFI